jgi:hypothetical protein
MCHWCDSWQEDTEKYNGYSFCCSGCVEKYKKSQTEDNQRKVEEIDREIERLKVERARLMESLGLGTKSKYPWK